MKATIFLGLVFLATVSCHHLSDSENQRRDENFISSSEHSREDHKEHNTYEHEAHRNFDSKKTPPAEPFRRIPAIRRTVPEEEPSDRDQSNEFSTIPIQTTPVTQPQVVYLSPQFPSGRREIPLPVYRTPSFSRIFNVAPVPVAYRPINPITYSVPVSVPRVRNVVLGYQPLNVPVRYALTPSNSAFDNGGLIAEEFDEFLKKK